MLLGCRGSCTLARRRKPDKIGVPKLAVVVSEAESEKSPRERAGGAATISPARTSPSPIGHIGIRLAVSADSVCVAGNRGVLGNALPLNCSAAIPASPELVRFHGGAFEAASRTLHPIDTRRSAEAWDPRRLRLPEAELTISVGGGKGTAARELIIAGTNAH